MPDGYRLVGYEAAGPKMGPITVATISSSVRRTSVTRQPVSATHCRAAASVALVHSIQR